MTVTSPVCIPATDENAVSAPDLEALSGAMRQQPGAIVACATERRWSFPLTIALLTGRQRHGFPSERPGLR